MQKAIYYVSRLIAARGIVELTDQNLNFQVSHLDASFGLKDLSIDLSMITDIGIEGGEMHPKVVINTTVKRHEFVLTKGQELYDRLRELLRDPLNCNVFSDRPESMMNCTCGKQISRLYTYCPWCGARI